MSRIFEIIIRDAAARIGKIVLDREISTPAIIRIQDKDSPIIDSGSIWKKNAHEPEHGKIVILPHKSLPLHTRSEVIKQLQDLKVQATPQNKGIVIHPLTGEYPASELYVLSAAMQLENMPREFIESIIRFKENTCAGSLLYTPALAVPHNLSLLIYMGVDIVDETLAIIKGYQDIYLTNSGEFPLDTLHEFPCSCHVCSSNSVQELLNLPGKERAELLSQHNSLKLQEELRIIRKHIMSGHLREYVERQCRLLPWLTAALRLVDAQHTFLEKRTPVFRSGTLYANTSESLNRVEIKRFAWRIHERFTKPDLDALVLLPCSAKKPYSFSQSHMKFISALGKYRKYVHEVIISSPVGIVPRELELMYPASHYDTPVTGHWDLEEKAWVGGCLKNYLLKNRYNSIIAHVSGAYREICENVEKELGLEFIYTSDNKVTSPDSLYNLKNAVSGLEDTKKRTSGINIDIMKAAADYQFGKGAGEMLTDGAIVRGNYPKLQLFSGVNQLATLVPQYGTIALTIEGGLRLREHPYYKVKIGDFIPHSSILAPGVEDADLQIRPGDEVIVEGEKFFGVGRALMSGWEMKERGRGVAVEVRHSRKIQERSADACAP